MRMISFDRLDGNVVFDGRYLMTLSAEPGKRVYGEKLTYIDNKEYRNWSPRRSKLSAYLMNGGRYFPFSKNSSVLYLGAASGTTASHVSDIVADGRVYCVEFATRTFRDLVAVCSGRKNMVPILGDATRPHEYSFAVESVDIVYQDVAQKGQVDILMKNMETFSAKHGMISIKARSEDVTSDPERIFRQSKKKLMDSGFTVMDAISLEPYEKAHAMIFTGRE